MYEGSKYPIRFLIGQRLWPGPGLADLATYLECPPEQNSKKWTSYCYSSSNFALGTFLTLSHSIVYSQKRLVIILKFLKRCEMHLITLNFFLKIFPSPKNNSVCRMS